MLCSQPSKKPERRVYWFRWYAQQIGAKKANTHPQ